MNKQYKDMVRKNNKKVKSLTGDYQIFATRVIKELRRYAIKSQHTEKVLGELLNEMRYQQNKNTRLYTYAPDVNSYIQSKYELFTKGNNHPTFNKKEIVIISIFVVIMVITAVFGIMLRRPVAFNAPSNVKIENNILYFNEVKYASSYRVKCVDANGKIIFEKTFFDDDDKISIGTINLTTISEMNRPGTYTIMIRTVKNGIYETSKWSKPITYVFNNSKPY